MLQYEKNGKNDKTGEIAPYKNKCLAHIPGMKDGVSLKCREVSPSAYVACMLPMSSMD